MRLHRLVVSAFGPFAGRVEVDVDTLAAGGIFLVHGPTGSGKTSLLDAICFALYAAVPGARPARSLVSHHAAGGARPEVELELTCGTRRLRVTRTPAYDRPKKRGSGATPVPATVRLEEHVDGSWSLLSARNDEVGQILTDDIVGMGLEQFAKVVMLPQGDVTAFLRARPEDRRQLLQRLFDIDRYTDIEEWFRERRRSTDASLARAEAAFHTAGLRVSDALGGSGEAALAGIDWVDVSPGDVPRRLVDLKATLSELEESSVAAFVAAESAAQSTSDALTRGSRLMQLRLKANGARARLAALEAGASERDRDHERVNDAERAAPVVALLSAVTRAEEACATSQAALAATEHDLFPLWDNGSDDTSVIVSGPMAAVDVVAAVADEVGHHSAQLEEARRARRDLAVREARLELVSSEREQLERSIDEAREGQRVAALALAEVTAQAAELDDTLASLDTLEDTVRETAERRDAGARVGADELLLGDLRELAASARTRAQDARQRALDLLAGRIEGLAAELALGLSDGRPCPVCGSADHPEPAASGVDPVSAEEVSRAQADADALHDAHALAEREVAALSASLEARRAALGGRDQAVLDAEHAAAVAALASARAAVAHRADLLARVESAAAESERVAALVTEARERHERLDGSMTEMRSDRDALVASIEQGLASHAAHCPCLGCASPASVDPLAEGSTVEATLEHHRSVHSMLDARVVALRELGERGDILRAARQDVEQACAEAGFADGGAAREVALTRDGLLDLRTRVAAYDHDLVQVHAVLADPEIREAEAADPVDLPGLTDAAERAHTRMLKAQSAQSQALRTRKSFDALRPAIEEAAADLAAHHERAAVIRELADIVSGTSASNVKRMSLTSYVLAARLERVVELANERLGAMGDGRYLLQHSDELAARGARSGLGLRVLDQWTGLTRETATLSGGEGFIASLALALALADAVREESGGSDFGTLFIDEGFGSLDDSSLEQVLDVLDGLREGGRAVGVVSHVGELRARITHQVVVTKSPTGSTAEVVLDHEHDLSA